MYMYTLYLITILTVLTGHIYLICYYYFLIYLGNIISTIYYLFLTSWEWRYFNYLLSIFKLYYHYF